VAVDQSLSDSFFQDHLAHARKGNSLKTYDHSNQI
jgi:hypothetical protein